MTLSYKYLIIIGLIVCGVALASTIAIISILYRLTHPRVDRQIMGEVTLSSDWVEITPKEPLEIKRQGCDLFINIREPFEPDYKSGGIRLSDGLILIPEVQLLDKNGNTFPLKPSSYSLKNPSDPNIHSGIGFLNFDLPRDRTYPIVRIRSERPLRCSNIVWSCFDR